MNLFVDESVDVQIADRPCEDGHIVVCVWELDPGVSDEQVLWESNRRGEVLITADKDFGELVFRMGQIHKGVVLIRLSGLSPETKADIVSKANAGAESHLDDGFIVISPGLVRVRKR